MSSELAAPATTTGENPTTTIPPRDVPSRRVDLGLGEVDLPRHFMGGDPVLSHVVAVLSCQFPEGEDFFVNSVRNYRSRIEDPELRRQVAGFIGQEAVHGREHRSFNEALGRLGYPVRFLDGRVRIGLRVLSKLAPEVHQLALTAALEHYTAALAEVLLTTDTLQETTDIVEVRHLFLWHALEESEHRSVAFDVFMQVSGNERIRVNVMRLATVGFLISIITGTVVSLALDPTARSLPKLRAGFARLRRNPMVGRRTRARILDYNRAGFHPDDQDTSDLLEHWRARLFGAEGELTDALRTSVAG